jgi:mono/diheme cytochrome c family protein
VPEWYFLFYYQLLKYSKGAWEPVLTFVLPALFFGLLFAAPFLGRSRERSPARRPVAIAAGVLFLVFVFVLLGQSLRETAAIALTDPAVLRGKALYDKLACAGCHQIHGTGAMVGPDLSYVGDRRDRDWLIAHSKDPQGVVPGSIAPGPARRPGDERADGVHAQPEKERRPRTRALTRQPQPKEVTMHYRYGLSAILVLVAGAASAAEPQALRVTAPPEVPPPITRAAPAAVSVHLETTERKGALADGVEYEFWTFGDTVPGPFIRVRVGDDVTIHLKNSEHSALPHSIDLHAVNGPGGGAVLTQVAPGDTKSFRWKALNPGLYVYHCATPHVPTHVANGMYGLILVEPKGGLPKVDREFVLQSEFYTTAGSANKGFRP